MLGLEGGRSGLGGGVFIISYLGGVVDYFFR
jgi:hypothetical protein